MKTIFLSIYDGDTEKNILRSNIFAHLKDSGNRIVLLIRGRDRLSYYKKNFEKENIVVELLPFAFITLERWWYHLGWNTIPTYSVHLRRYTNYLRHGNFFRYVLERLAGIMGKFRWWRFVLRCIYRYWPDSYADALFDKYRPDLLFSPNMFSPEDFRLLRQAKKRGIKTIATAKSWDVLTTKAFTRVIADQLLVFNEFNKEEAIKIGDYPPERVTVTGFPQFDVYHKKDVIVPRGRFFKSFSLDPAKHLIFFAIPGGWKTAYMQEIIEGLEKAFRKGQVHHLFHVLAQFHPKYPNPVKALKNLTFFTLNRPGTLFSESREGSIDMNIGDTFAWTFTDRDIVQLANCLYHSDIVIVTESTIALDAANFDKPIITIGYDGNHTLDYWHSIINMYDKDHFRHVMDTGGVRLARSEQELIEYINRYLSDPSLDANGRARLRRTMLYREDGQASRRVAEAVLSML